MGNNNENVRVGARRNLPRSQTCRTCFRRLSGKKTCILLVLLRSNLRFWYVVKQNTLFLGKEKRKHKFVMSTLCVQH